ncbi:hypothetical protein EPN95_02010 [Patescibacteria group bacterium]|nr:MAG: hypothetical protein EPN95_02010 [Patescibacteria group bacterium]
MVEVVQEDAYPQSISMSFSWWQIAVTGLAVGALYYILTFLIGQFIIDPLYCGASLNAANCSNSVGISGNIATILVGTIGLGIMVSLRVVRPIIVAAMTAILLWGLSVWTSGLSWGEIVLWSSLLYGLAYVAFAWICRYNQTMPVIIISILVSVVARIVVSL